MLPNTRRPPEQTPPDADARPAAPRRPDLSLPLAAPPAHAPPEGPHCEVSGGSAALAALGTLGATVSLVGVGGALSLSDVPVERVALTVRDASQRVRLAHLFAQMAALLRG